MSRAPITADEGAIEGAAEVLEQESEIFSYGHFLKLESPTQTAEIAQMTKLSVGRVK